jgi:hypothetical protein
MMHNKRNLIWLVPLGLVAMALFGYLGGKVVEWLWNWLMPMLFGLRTVTFWQALGVLALSRILFGGSGFMRGGGHHKPPAEIRKRIMDRVSDRIVERWDQMTPEERERLWQRLQEKRAGNQV